MVSFISMLQYPHTANYDMIPDTQLKQLEKSCFQVIPSSNLCD